MGLPVVPSQFETGRKTRLCTDQRKLHSPFMPMEPHSRASIGDRRRASCHPVRITAKRISCGLLGGGYGKLRR